MSYLCLSQKEFHFEEYSLISLRYEDVFLIKDWRNEQMEILRQATLLTNKDQERYYINYVKPTFELERPPQILFSFIKENKCIGYGGLTNINWDSKRAEVSFLLETSRANDSSTYTRDFESFLIILKRITFEHLNINRLFTETYDIRPLHISILEKNKFLFEGRLKKHNIINDNYIDSLIHGCLKENYK